MISNVIPLSPNDSSFGYEKKRQSKKRMTIQLTSELDQHLQWLADRQGVTQVEAIRKAIAFESYIRQEVQKPGTRLIIEDINSIRELIIT